MTPPPHPPDPPLGPAYAAALGAAVAETSRAVEGVHRAISRTAFGAVRWVPGLGLVARAIERTHDAIAGAAYASVRVGATAGVALAPRVAPPIASHSRLSSRLRSALNGTHGDALAAAANPLAHEMAFYDRGRPIPLTPEHLHAALPGATGRLCVFIHGLCCDESAWGYGGRGGGGAYGARLREELGYTPLYLRYNTGLPLAENGLALAQRLQALVEAAPQPIREVVLVGHSMGGLVALGACAVAEAQGLSWLERASAIVGLGVPLRGSPVAKVGHAATSALRAVPLTAALGALADARSVGVRDLRYGFGAEEPPVRRPLAYRFVGASMHPDAEGLLGRLVGDGFVPAASAAPSGWAGDVAAVRIGGLGHMALLNDDRVYAHLARWLTELAAS